MVKKEKKLTKLVNSTNSSDETKELKETKNKISKNKKNDKDANIEQDFGIEFLVDKYIPSNVDDVIEPIYEHYENLTGTIDNDWKTHSPTKCYFHKEILHKLKTISSDDCLPHIIFYGNPGSGKKTLINLFLEQIFDKSVYNLDDSKYTVYSSGNIENEVFVKQSDHHIIIEPGNNNFDRYLIQDIVKEYAKRYPLCIFESSREFKMVQINHLDNLSYYAQTSLRRTIEKYSKTCRFIMWCYSLSKVIEPLRSRCLCIHVPSQTEEELVKWTFNIAAMEKINLNLNTLTNIVETSCGNLKDILWKLDMYQYCGTITNCYQMALSNLIDEILTTHNILTIRDLIYKMMITGITSCIIIKDILNIILTKITNHPKEKIFSVINFASTYEYRLSKGRRDIIHVETFIENVISILKQK